MRPSCRSPPTTSPSTSPSWSTVPPSAPSAPCASPAVPGRRRSSTAARRWSRPPSTGAVARGGGGPDRARRPRRGQRAGGGHRAARHDARARGPPRRRPRRRQRLPLDHLRARRGEVRLGLLRPARPQGTAHVHGHRAGGVDRGEQLRRPGGRGRRRRAALDVRADAAAVDVQPRRGRRAVRRGAHAGRWLRPRPLRPTDARGPAAARRRAAVHAHRAGPRVLRRALRHAVPAALLRPGVPARVRRGDGELRLRHLGRRHPAPARADDRRVAGVRQRAAARDGAHVVRQHRDDALVGRPLAQRGLRGVRLHVGGRAGHGRTATPRPTTWWATSCAPTSPTRGPAPTRSASPCPRSRTRSRSSTPSPTPRARRCSSSSCTSSARTPSARA